MFDARVTKYPMTLRTILRLTIWMAAFGLCLFYPTGASADRGKRIVVTMEAVSQGAVEFFSTLSTVDFRMSPVRPPKLREEPPTGGRMKQFGALRLGTEQAEFAVMEDVIAEPLLIDLVPSPESQAMRVTGLGRRFLPSLKDFRSYRAFPTRLLNSDWEVEATFAGNASGAADPVVVRNKNDGGRVAVLYQTDNDSLPRAAVLREFFTRWAPTVAPLAKMDIALYIDQTWWISKPAAVRVAKNLIRSLQKIVSSIAIVSEEDMPAWAQRNTGDGDFDVLALFGDFPQSIYPSNNTQPDGSPAERFLEDGNMILNTADYIFWGQGRNAAEGLIHMMDNPGKTDLYVDRDADGVLTAADRVEWSPWTKSDRVLAGSAVLSVPYRIGKNASNLPCGIQFIRRPGDGTLRPLIIPDYYRRGAVKLGTQTYTVALRNAAGDGLFNRMEGNANRVSIDLNRNGKIEADVEERDLSQYFVIGDRTYQVADITPDGLKLTFVERRFGDSERKTSRRPSKPAYPVTFRFTFAGAKQVYLLGSFNDWDPSRASAMRFRKGEWTATLNLDTGIYAYKFKVTSDSPLPDDGWMRDPGNPLVAENQFGTLNSLVAVPPGFKPDTGALLAAFREALKDEVEALGNIVGYHLAQNDVPAAERTYNRIRQSMDEDLSEHAGRMVWTAKQREKKRKYTAREAPDIRGTTLAGRPLALSDFRGKIVLIDFWATWCGPCMYELPNVKRIYETYKDSGLAVIGIGLDHDTDQLNKTIKDKSIPWPQMFDGKAWEGPLVKAYGVDGIPATYLLNSSGQIVAMDLRGGELEKKIGEMLEGIK